MSIGPEITVLESSAGVVAYAGRLETRHLSDDIGLADSTSIPTLLTSALERRGIGSLAKLTGQFALLYWAAGRQQGILATDRLGTRSIFFAQFGRILRFGLEVRDLLVDMPEAPAPDRLAVGRWIIDGSLDRGQTLFEDVSRLPGGHAICFDHESWRLERYWRPRSESVLRLPRSELRDAVRAAVTSAVGARVVPGATALLVSGGLDSGTVAVAARAAVPERRDAVRLYSFGFPGHPETDERDYIGLIRDKIAAPAGMVDFHRGSAVFGALRYIDEWCLPPLTPMLSFVLPTLELAADEGNTVALDGEGGDELFACDLYLIADRIRNGRLIGASHLVRRIEGRPNRMPRRMLLRALGSFGVRPALPHRAGRFLDRLPRSEGPRLLRPEMRQVYLEMQDRFRWTRGSGPRWWAEKAYRLTVGREELGAFDLLRHRAELAGLVSAHPLMDDAELVEFCLRLPPELSFDPVLSRPLLREAMADLLPEAVRSRSTKTDFGGVLKQALTVWDLPVVEELLGRRPRVAEYVDGRFMRDRILAASVPRDGLWGWQVWRLLTIECWLRTLDDPAFPSRLRSSGRLLPAEFVAHRAR